MPPNLAEARSGPPPLPPPPGCSCLHTAGSGGGEARPAFHDKESYKKTMRGAKFVFHHVDVEVSCHPPPATPPAPKPKEERKKKKKMNTKRKKACSVRDERAASEISDKASRKEGKGKLPVLVVCLICTGSIQHDDAQALRDGDQRREQPTQLIPSPSSRIRNSAHTTVAGGARRKANTNEPTQNVSNNILNRIPTDIRNSGLP
uniref:Uncharacterized protein n=1 Tax=Oryza nivara TaxID=4536 RepID=A0A0E0H793_ORYNI